MKYKRIILCVLIIFVFLVPCGTSQIVAQGRKIAEVQKRGVLIVGMIEKDQYPFFFKNKKNELVGLDVDIAKRIAVLLNVSLKINRNAKSFNNLIPLILAKKIDVAISKLSRTLYRSQKVIFSNPYIVFNQALLLNRVQLAKVSSNDNEIIEILRTFSGRLGVIKNSSYERYAKVNFPYAQFVLLDTWEDVLDALGNSKVFGIYRDEMEITKYITQNPQTNLYLKPVVIKDRKDPIAIAMPAEAAHFSYFVNLVLESMDIPTGAKELLEKYKK